MPIYVDREISDHLLRDDGQEDICLATYNVSTGDHRTTYVVNGAELPRDGDRRVHGNASIMGHYVLRVAAEARSKGLGVAIMHSHPRGIGWQGLSAVDAETEAGLAATVERVTGRPLVGMTLGGDGSWSARTWTLQGGPAWAQSVRIVGDHIRVTWNDALAPAAVDRNRQARTISAWGEDMHKDITRLRVLVVGLGSVGLDVVQRLAATGVCRIGVMDFDRVEAHNLDRMIGATRRDARLRRRKIDVASRLAARAATAPDVEVAIHDMNVCTPEGLSAVLDYDVVFSCVDRPWPRAVLNTIAYADLIPVIEGGIGIDALASGHMRGATRRMQTATPGRPCMFCSGQVSAAEVTLDQSGDLDDPEYIRQAGTDPIKAHANVAALAAGVSSAQLDQFVSLIAHPAGIGVPPPLRYIFSTHTLERVNCKTEQYCTTELDVAAGDRRLDLTRAPGPPRRRSGTSTRPAHWLVAAVDWFIASVENCFRGR